MQNILKRRRLNFLFRRPHECTTKKSTRSILMPFDTKENVDFGRRNLKRFLFKNKTCESLHTR